MGRRVSLGVLLAACFFLSGTAGGAESVPAGKEPAGQEPAWYQGNTHTHSFWSDGDDFPEMVADWYKRNGYHFLVLDSDEVNAMAAPGGEAEGRAQAVAAWLSPVVSDVLARLRKGGGAS